MVSLFVIDSFKQELKIINFETSIRNAEVVKLVDTHVSGACGASCAGSSPAFGTLRKLKQSPRSSSRSIV